MQIDIQFPFAKIYDISKVDVVIGQGFTLLTDFAGKTKWFADNDPVLAITVEGSNARVETTDIGESIILIMDGQFAIMKKIFIKVIEGPASDLGLTADAPEHK